MTERILLVEDDARLADMLSEYLGEAGFRVVVAPLGSTAFERLAHADYDAVVLDLMLPDMDGLDVCRKLRSKSDTPVLMLTARGDATDRIVGLELGADDYMTKPFSPRELVLRCHAILRRVQEAGTAPGGRVLKAGPLRMDLGAHQATLDGEEMSLTPTEFRLLQALMERRGRTQSRRQLLEKAWDVESDISDRIQTRTVDMHVRRLRSKLGGAGEWVETVRGFGYRLRVPGEDA
jgi:two-component system phosphate regulon response regulator PhoB